MYPGSISVNAVLCTWDPWAKGGTTKQVKLYWIIVYRACSLMSGLAFVDSTQALIRPVDSSAVLNLSSSRQNGEELGESVTNRQTSRSPARLKKRSLKVLIGCLMLILAGETLFIGYTQAFTADDSASHPCDEIVRANRVLSTELECLTRQYNGTAKGMKPCAAAAALSYVNTRCYSELVCMEGSSRPRNTRRRQRARSKRETVLWHLQTFDRKKYSSHCTDCFLEIVYWVFFFN